MKVIYFECTVDVNFHQMILTRKYYFAVFVELYEIVQVIVFTLSVKTFEVMCQIICDTVPRNFWGKIYS